MSLSKDNKLKKRFADAKIKTKIIVPFLALAFVSLIILGPIASIWVYQKINDAAKRYLHSQESTVDVFLAGIEKNVQDNAKAIGETPGLAEDIGNGQIVKMRQKLAPQRIALNLDFIEILDEKGRVVFNDNGPFPPTTDLSRLPVIQNAVLRMITVDLVKTPNGWTIWATAPVISFEREVAIVGIIGIGYQLNAQFLKRIKNLTGNDIAVFKDFKLLATTYKGAGKTTCNSCHQEYYLFPAIRKIILKGEKIEPKEIIMGDWSFLLGHSSIKLHGKDVAFYSMLMPLTEIKQMRATATKNIILVEIIWVLLIIVLGYAIARNITKPIIHLVEATREISGGDLTQQVAIRCNDELGELAVSFNKMISNLHELVTKLKASRKQVEFAVNSVGRVLSSAFNQEKLLKAVLYTAVKTIGSRGGSLLLLNVGGRRLVVRADGLHPSAISKTEQKVNEDLVNWVIKTGKPFFFNQKVENSHFVHFKAQREIKDTIAVPLRTRGKVIGVLSLVDKIDGDFDKNDQSLLITLSNEAAIAIENARLFEDLHNAHLNVVKALAAAVDAKDPYTHGHSARVAKYAVVIAQELGFSEFQIEGIETAAYLHDIGKIGISDHILQKPEELTEEERDVIKTHPSISAKILGHIDFPWNILPLVSGHHERPDGDGYPNGLRENQIPLGARILALADAFEAMISERPYRHALSLERAVLEIKKKEGTQFDPEVVKAFLCALRKGKILAF